MKTMYLMLFRIFIPIFVVTLLFFMLLFQLMDLFSNIYKYSAQNTSLLEIGKIAFYYLPKCLSYSLPIGLLFSITFTLGNLYMNNELIAIFGSGISLYKFTFPFLVLSLLICLGYFMFEENVVISTLSLKTEYQQEVLNQREPTSSNNIAIKSVDNRVVYQAQYFNARNNNLRDLTVLRRDDEGNLEMVIKASSADWSGEFWILKDCRVFRWNETRTEFQETYAAVYEGKELTEDPRLFRTQTRKIDEMDYRTASLWVKDLKDAGKSYNKELSEYYKKFAFSFTPLIVALISCSIGGLLRKNVLLMSLLISIFVVVGYYVIQLMTMSLSAYGYIHPILGAWSAFIVFSILGVVLFRLART